MKKLLKVLIVLTTFISLNNCATAQDIRSRIAFGFSQKSCKVAIILPLGSKYQDSTKINNFMDFYAGALLAVEDSKRLGISSDIEVFDSDDYSNLSLLVQSGRLNDFDFIIGPVLSADLEKIMPFANEKGIPVISPLDPRSESLTLANPYLFQATTPLVYQQRTLLSGIVPGDHTTIISENSNIDRDLISLTADILRENSVKFNTLSYSLEKDKSILNQILSRLDKSSLNNIIVPSNSEAFVYDVLRNLNLLSTMHGYRIKVYGTSRWRNFELVDLSYLHSMNLTLSLNYYIDYTSQPVKDFVFRYRALYKSEPNAYAFQAYDITHFFLSCWSGSGLSPESIERSGASMLQSDIKFVKNGEGYVNGASRKIEYLPDFSINFRTSLR